MADDSDFAFNLQLEEALTASLLDGAISSPNADGVTYDAVFGPALSAALQRDDDLYKYECELLDQYSTKAAEKLLRLDLCRQVHDRAFACEISNIPEEEWRKIGDELQKPYGEGSSSSSNGKCWGFRVYVKGLVQGIAGGVAVVIRDDNGGSVFELSKGLSRKDQIMVGAMVELKALIEGLEAAVMLELKRVTIVTDNRLLYLHITGKSREIRETFAVLSNQIDLLMRKLGNPGASFVTCHDNAFAVELARKAIAFEVNRSAGSSGTKNLMKTCTICLEDTDVDQMLLIAECLHSYCLSCMSKHVHYKLLQGILPKCPDENCKYLLPLDSCRKFLTPELFDMMCQRVKEASIPPAEKIYCPYSRCSTLL
ncbi:uncharacterized protein LOC121743167 isoform X2 [Salvia splendens]|uniref:uncharacterized protein LOC121743167 isoform X2 n=1 Tax=Salvia splendens TaxID=180675 RepID=UPI001C27374C|nr:uncharacterized protein LOC121743167 isoform X2 [Salvia splendens]